MRENVQDLVPPLVGSSLASGGNAASVVDEESSEVKPKPNVVEENSRSSSSPDNKYSIGLDSGVLQTPSPVSAHQSSSSSSSCLSETCVSLTSGMVTHVRSRSRSHSRLSTTNPHRFEEVSRSKGVSESNLMNTKENPVKRKLKLHFKLRQQSGTTETRKCSHCGTKTTPEWRKGPMGPSTLCNACGVRYRLGRLFPEYRPAGSPTFVPSLHSNSHSVVVQMRKGAIQEAETEPPTLPLRELEASEQ